MADKDDQIFGEIDAMLDGIDADQSAPAVIDLDDEAIEALTDDINEVERRQSIYKQQTSVDEAHQVVPDSIRKMTDDELLAALQGDGSSSSIAASDDDGDTSVAATSSVLRKMRVRADLLVGQMMAYESSATIGELPDDALQHRCEATMAQIEKLPVKTQEKSVNLFRGLQSNRRVSTYTALALKTCIETARSVGPGQGVLRIDDLKRNYEERGYKPGTVNSQANQSMGLLSAVGVVTPIAKGEYQISEDHPIIHQFEKKQRSL